MTHVSTLPTASELRARMELRFAKKGLAFGLLAGLIFAVSSVLLLGPGVKQLTAIRPELWIVAPLFAAGLHDLTACLFGMGINYARGQGREIWRTLASRPGRYCLTGAFLGAPFGMGAYLLSISLAGAAYALPITSLYPAWAAVLAVFILKERVPLRTWLGMTACVVGACVIGYTPPEGATSSYFYLGILFAVIASLGWATEGVIITSGMDFVEPGVALNIYHMVSACLYMGVILPLAVHFTLPDGGQNAHYFAVLGELLASPGILFVCLAGLMGCMSYLSWYIAMSTIGVSRAMALNITYALWGVVLSAFFLDGEITATLVAGALIIFVGMLLVVGNPQEMLNLRKVES